MPPEHVDPHDHSHLEPDVLDDGMTPADIAFALRHLRFNRRHAALGLLRIDRGVRDYLVGLIEGRRSRGSPNASNASRGQMSAGFRWAAVPQGDHVFKSGVAIDERDSGK